jgi:hypothetical protein
MASQARASKRNLRRALLMLEACKTHQSHLSADQDVQLCDWEHVHSFLKPFPDLLFGDFRELCLEMRGWCGKSRKCMLNFCFVRVLRFVLLFCFFGVVRVRVFHGFAR